VTDQPVGEGAVSYSHSGERFVLGWGADFFGIWDRQESGGPIVQFPRTDVGWEQAWREFVGREHRFVEVSPGGAAPGRTVFRPTAGLAKTLPVMVGVTAVLAMLTIAARAGLIARLGEYERGDAFRASVVEAGHTVDAMAQVTFWAIFVTGIVWIIWHYRAHSNLSTFGVTGLRYSPGAVVAWWIVPLANLILPVLTTAETWKASAAAADGQPSDWRVRRVPSLLGWWWASWVTRVPLGAVAAVLSVKDNASTNDVLNRAYAGLGTDVALIVAAAFAIAVVRGIQRLQDQAASITSMVGVA
jgi:uncharacterized protein DUF4328